MATPEEPNTQPTDSQSQEIIYSQDIDSEVWGKLYPLAYKLKPEELTRPVYEVGRGMSCDIRMTMENIDPLILPLISKVQFRVNLEKDDSGLHVFSLVDLSSNGTFVNNKKIGQNNKVFLKNNDEISLSQPQNKAYVFVEAQLCNSWLPLSEVNRYAILTHLGSGAFGEVKLAINKKTGCRCAIKKVMKNIEINGKNCTANEIKILRKLRHAFIVRMEGLFESEEAVFIILEYMSGGDLRRRLRQVKKLDENEAKFLFHQLLLAVQYLHGEGITHRDLKPENILLTSENGELMLKLSDFGLAKLTHSTTALKTLCGTLLYTAPEIINSRGLTTYTPKVDVWSLGCILYHCLSGEPPFSAEKLMPLQEQIVRGCYDKTKLIKCSTQVMSSAIGLIERMLVSEPAKRFSIDEALNHKWLQDRHIKFKVERLLVNNAPVEENMENLSLEFGRPRKIQRLK